MNPITNRRAEDFERALTAKSVSVDPTTAALVAVAGALAALPKGPTPAFREGLRTQLMAEAARLAAAPVPAAAPAAIPAPASPLQTLGKVLAKPAMQVATGGLAATIAASGVGVGTHRALPGDALYGLKRALSDLGAPDDTGTVLDAVPDRVEEIVALLERDGLAAVAEVEALIADLRAQLDRATADLLAQVRAGSRTAYDRLRAEVGAVTDLLQALRGRLPDAARDDLDAAMATVNAARAQLAALPVPGLPGLPGGPGTSVTPKPGVPPTSTTPPAPTKSPSSGPTDAPTTIPPSTIPVTPPTITVPPVTVPPLPTVEPTLPVEVPLVP